MTIRYIDTVTPMPVGGVLATGIGDYGYVVISADEFPLLQAGKHLYFKFTQEHGSVNKSVRYRHIYYPENWASRVYHARPSAFPSIDYLDALNKSARASVTADQAARDKGVTNLAIASALVFAGGVALAGAASGSVAASGLATPAAAGEATAAAATTTAATTTAATTTAATTGILGSSITSGSVFVDSVVTKAVAGVAAKAIAPKKPAANASPAGTVQPAKVSGQVAGLGLGGLLLTLLFIL